MGYRNAEKILPPALLQAVQQYAEGECLYVPRREKQSRRTSAESARQQAERNDAIRRCYRAGWSVRRLAEEYYLSPQSSYKILKGGS